MAINYNIPDENEVGAFDAKEAVKSLEKLFTKQITKMKKIADDFLVKDQATMDQAIDMTNQAKKLGNAVEKEKKVIKKPYLAFNKTVDEMVRALKGPLVEIQLVLNGKIKPVALDLQKKEAARLKKAAEEQARIAKANADKVVKTPAPAVPIAPTKAATGTFKSNEGSATIKTFKKWDIVDFKAVPRKYKYTAIDQEMLDKDIQAGVVVAGCRIEDDIDLKTRVSRS